MMSPCCTLLENVRPVASMSRTQGSRAGGMAKTSHPRLLVLAMHVGRYSRIMQTDEALCECSQPGGIDIRLLLEFVCLACLPINTAS
jgi:hypothetical protein